jgi:hypothetical protein
MVRRPPPRSGLPSRSWPAQPISCYSTPSSDCTTACNTPISLAASTSSAARTSPCSARSCVPAGCLVLSTASLPRANAQDLDLEDEPPIALERVEPEAIADLVYLDEETKKRLQQRRDDALMQAGGFSPELAEGS